MAESLMGKGFKLVSGGTENHLVLVNLKESRGIDGARVENVCDKVRTNNLTLKCRNIKCTIQFADDWLTR